jgi:hypothetical protein
VIEGFFVLSNSNGQGTVRLKDGEEAEVSRRKKQVMGKYAR